MRSYPNLVPLDAASVRRIGDVLEAWPFDPIYGGWWDRIIISGGKAALSLSVKRYLAAVGGPPATVAREGLELTDQLGLQPEQERDEHHRPRDDPG